MDAKLRAPPPTRVYKDFEPTTEWVSEEDCDTLLLHVPGFRKEQLRVQLTSKRSLIISGERPIENDIWNRFIMELPVLINCDTNKISANFEGSILRIIQPKLITPAEEQDKSKPTSEAPKPQQPVNEPQPQKNLKEQASQKSTSMANPDEKTNELTDAKTVFEEGKESRNTDPKSSESMDSKNAFDKSPGREKIDSNSVSEKILKEVKSTGIAEDGEMTRNTSEKHVSDAVNDAMKMDEGTTEDFDDIGKTRLVNYTYAIDGLATKLKMPRKVMNFVLLILLALVLGLYVTNLIKSWKKTKN